MNDKTLRALIRSLIAEIRDNPRVGDQLRKPDGSPESRKKEKEHEDEVEEASGAGAIVGPMLPLGMKTPGKKKKPGWR